MFIFSVFKFKDKSAFPLLKACFEYQIDWGLIHGLKAFRWSGFQVWHSDQASFRIEAFISSTTRSEMLFYRQNLPAGASRFLRASLER